ncbi:MAG TPA: hypothetical protein VFY16_00865 [Gemmatimonadaceae bacterium]|nr:hypothetical protein [Gemmatimonadaceae bacterium]
MRSTIITLLAFLGTACAHGVGRAPIAPARDALRAADAALADATWRDGLPTAFAAVLADDAIFLAEGHPVVRGRAAVLALLRGDSALAALRQRATAARVDVSADGRHGYSFGVAQVVVRPMTSALRGARYAAYWRRDGAGVGAWRVVAYVRSAASGVPRDGATLAPADPPAPAVTGPASRWEAELRDADTRFAALGREAGLGEAFTTWAAPYGAMLGAGPTLVVGRDAIRAAFRAADSAGVRARWAPVHAGAAASGDLGFTVGEATFLHPTPEGGTKRS